MISPCGPGPEIPSITSPKDPLRGKCTQRSLEGGGPLRAAPRAQWPGEEHSAQKRGRTQRPEPMSKGPVARIFKEEHNIRRPEPMSQDPVAQEPIAQGPMGKSQCPSAHNPVPKLARDEHSAQSLCPKAQWPGIFGK